MLWLTIGVTLLFSASILMLLYLLARQILKRKAQQITEDYKALLQQGITKPTEPVIYQEPTIDKRTLLEDCFAPMLTRIDEKNETLKNRYEEAVAQHRERVRKELMEARQVIQESEDLTGLTRTALTQTIEDMQRHYRLEEVINGLLQQEAEELRSQRSRGESDDSNKDRTGES